MAIEHITTEDQYNEKVKQSEKPVIIDFWAEWCGPCKVLGPVFEKLAEEEDDVKFVKVNVDEGGDIAAKFNVMSIPTVVFMKDGEVVDQTMGAMQKEQLQEFIDKNKESQEE